MPVKKRNPKERRVVVTEEAAAKFRELVDLMAAATRTEIAVNEADAALDLLLGHSSKPWLESSAWQESPPASLGSTGMTEDLYDSETHAYEVFNDLVKASGIKLEQYFEAKYRGRSLAEQEAA
jgi:hypothetical protein